MMIKGYYTVKPCQNKYLQRRSDERCNELHEKALATVKPTVDTTAPKTTFIIHKTSKKSRLSRENNTRIEQENERLLNRMQTIAHFKGYVDNQNHYSPKSLNEEQRRNEAHRIEIENKNLVKRLTEQRNAQCQRWWELEWARTLIRMHNISRYPWSWTSKQTENDASRRQHKTLRTEENAESAKTDRETPAVQTGNLENDEPIRPFIETVGNEAVKQLADVIPARMIIDFNDPTIKKDPDYCKLKEDGSRTGVPDGIRGFVASVIQSALYHVYEQDFSSRTPRETTIDATENLLQLTTDSDGAFDLSTYQPNNFEVFEKDSLAANLRETGKQRVILDDESHPTPNIVWPTIGEFNKELGLKKIEEYIQGWQLHKNWLHCTDLLSVQDGPYDVFYRYRVRWSIPTRRQPIPRATASIYFTLQVSKIKPKTQQVGVYYQVETFRTIHRPGNTRFCEQWLRDVIDSKARLMPYISF
ncbi:hypothetical protein EG68_04848 [Paragonimus skrjabini miyazakii]|uniref:A-kinase anchor protein 14 n=1 Tax=Paragonimus skrjabini miyazakii TaxID=59628 RepID=A0A8S9Z429_9TREM|nr:hypothetical protein EG68_04848 [Paragonimus skrjabini miyazakii]